MERASRSAFCRIRAVGNAIRRRMESLHAEDKSGLTGGECAIMGFLMEHMGDLVYQKDIEEEFHIRRSSATRALQAMEKKGFILRQSESHDGRLKRLTLTERAIEMSREASRSMAEQERRLLSGISNEELAAFLDICDRICLNAEAMEAEERL